MNLQEKRREVGLEQADLAKRVGTNAPMMSNFENHKCIPVPLMLKAICRELNCEITDIYKPEEIYVSKHKRKGALDEKSCYRLTVDLPNKARMVFSSTNLKKHGYKNLKDFMWHCYKWLEKKMYNKKEKATEQDRCPVTHENDIFENISHQ